MERRGYDVIGAIRDNLLVGIKANRNEYGYAVSHDDPRVMPVMRRLLWGWVIMQEGGLAISEEELVSEWPFRLPFPGVADLAKVSQYCRRRNNRQIVLVDFGQEAVTEFLAATFP